MSADDFKRRKDARKRVGLKLESTFTNRRGPRRNDVYAIGGGGIETDGSGEWRVVTRRAQRRRAEAGATMEGADCGVHTDATGSMIAFERLPRDEHASLFSYKI